MAQDEVENYMNTPTPFMAPVVDQLSIRVVVDSHYERFLPKEYHPNVKIEHVGGIPGRQMTTLAGEWGLALHLNSASRGTKAQYLLDFGYTPEILNRNFSLLDIDPGPRRFRRRLQVDDDPRSSASGYPGERADHRVPS